MSSWSRRNVSLFLWLLVTLFLFGLVAGAGAGPAFAAGADEEAASPAEGELTPDEAPPVGESVALDEDIVPALMEVRRIDLPLPPWVEILGEDAGWS